MADNIVLNPGALGATVATDDDGTAQHQYVKIEFGADGVFTKVAAANPLPVNWAGTAPPIGAGLEATALRVTMATDSTGVVSVDDNGSTLTIDGSVTAIAQPGVDIGDVTINNAGSAAAVNIQDGGNTITVDGTVIVGSITAGDTNIGNVDIVTVPAPLSVVGTGTEAAAMRVTIATDSTGVLSVDDNGASLTVDNAALSVVGNGAAATALRVSLANDSTGIVALTTSAAAIGKLAANSGIDIGDVDVTSVVPGVAATNLGKAEDAGHTTGDTGVMLLGVANTGNAAISGTTLDYTPIATDLAGAVHITGELLHDAADSGNPLKIGARGVTSVLAQTLVVANDRTDVFAGTDGVLIARPYCSLGDVLSERVSNTDGASTACTGAFAATASQYIYITTIVVHNAHATTNGYVDIRDGTAGAVLMTIPLPATGGSVVSLPVPLRFSANTAVAFDVSAAITTVYLSFVGFKAKA